MDGHASPVREFLHGTVTGILFYFRTAEILEQHPVSTDIRLLVGCNSDDRAMAVPASNGSIVSHPNP